MKPHSLSSVQRTAPSKNRLFEALGPIAARHGRIAKGDILPETRVLACPRVKVSDLPDGFIPQKYFESSMEHNQLLPSCCRHPENHDIEAHKSHPDEEAPDIYIFICNDCGRQHKRLMLAVVDDFPRPVWDAS